MTLSARFQEAMLYADELHRDQTRKGTSIPYISHPLAVAGIVMEHGGGENEAIAALLHDGIEDGGGQPVREEILRRFGEQVAEIVEGCTDTDQTPKPPWLERKKAYIEHVRHAPPSVALVSAADKLHNGRAILLDYRSLGEQLWPRFNGGKKGTLWYYRAIIEAFEEAGTVPPVLMGELDRTVSELEALAGNATT